MAAKYTERECHCGLKFTVKVSEVVRGKGKCCSLSCAAVLASKARSQAVSSNNNWRGGLYDATGRKRRYRENNPDRHAAHLAVRNALRRGEIARQPCEVCAEPLSEAHHDDYSKPLSVRWLCKPHHLAEHRGNFRSGK